MTRGQRKNQKTIRSRTERIMRYMFRRRPCMIIITMECATLSVFLALTIFLFKTIGYRIEEVERHAWSNDMIEHHRSILNLWTCEFQPIWTSEKAFNIQNCNNHEEQGAITYVIHHLYSNTSGCLPHIHMEPCHEDVTVEVPQSFMYKCPGVNSPMNPELIGTYSEVYIPLVTNQDLENHLRQNILTTSLIAKCPRCQVATNWIREERIGFCSRYLHTARQGWPWQFRYCDLRETVKVDINSGIYCG